RVLIVHSKITFSIARNVIMIGLLSKREDVVTTSSRLVFIYSDKSRCRDKPIKKVKGEDNTLLKYYLHPSLFTFHFIQGGR
ncbi:MAG: hypothetical protein K2M02_08600, partial [Duncaniella sp.]|nr:hypothetical protein [Duncaniella sp.]